jgi:tetratricopeptide (TPR) repeat protein
MSIESTLDRWFWAVFLLFFAAAIGFSYRLAEVEPPSPAKTFFVPEPEFVERFSGTFRGLVAQAFYLKGVQELAFNSDQKVDLLMALFRVAVRVDPKLTNAAFLGGIVTPARAPDLVKAIALLKDIEPLMAQEWKIPYWIGFTYLQLEQYERAAEYYKKAGELPGALPFLARAHVSLLGRGASLEPALEEAQRMLEAAEEGDSVDWVVLRIEWLKNMLHLEHLAREYKGRTGRFPDELEEVVAAGLIDKIPEDEFGGGFYLVKPENPEEGYRVRSRLD